MSIKIAILASTNATDMKGIIEAINLKTLDAKITCCITNKKECGAIDKANKNNIDSIFIDPKGKTREEFDKACEVEIDKRKNELILLIGYMRILSSGFVKKYENKIMNVHPSILPAFAGGMDLNVHEEVLKRGCKITGCTVHFVDEGADTGPIIIQKCVPIEDGETPETLKIKVQKKEVEAFIEAIKLFSEKRLEVKGNIVKIK